MPLEGLDDLREVLDRLPDVMLGAAERGVAKALKLPQAEAKMLAQSISSQMAGSIVTVVLRVAGKVTGHVVVGSEIGTYAEFGTGPVGQASNNGKAPGKATYSIGPWKHKRRLKSGEIREYARDGWVYKDPKTGKFRFTRGQPARPYLYPAWKSNEKRMIQAVAEESGKIGGELT